MKKNTFANIFKHEYVLASESPRRKKLLKQIGLNFISISSRIREIDSQKHKPLMLVKYNSKRKAQKVAEDFENKIVIGADTIVVLKNQTLGKPKNSTEAKKFLRLLSGKKHLVYTGIYLVNTITCKEVFGFEKTEVFFRDLSKDEIDFYVKQFKPFDKAGAYGIQDDFGCLFIKKIVGDYYNIVGLPLVKLYEMISRII